MDDVSKKVLEETERFREALPDLLEEYGEKWVVFREGKVVAAFDSEDEAYGAGLDMFGEAGGHIIMRVAPDQVDPAPITAGAVYSLG